MLFHYEVRHLADLLYAHARHYFLDDFITYRYEKGYHCVLAAHLRSDWLRQRRTLSNASQCNIYVVIVIDCVL